MDAGTTAARDRSLWRKIGSALEEHSHEGALDYSVCPPSPASTSLMLRPLLLPLLLVAALPAVHGAVANCPVGSWKTGDADNFIAHTCNDGQLCQVKMTAGKDKKPAKKEGACVAACGVDTGKCLVLKGTSTVECCMNDVSRLWKGLSGLSLRIAPLTLRVPGGENEITIDTAKLKVAAKVVNGVEVGEKYHFHSIYLSIINFAKEAHTSAVGTVFKPKPKAKPQPKPEPKPEPNPEPQPKPEPEPKPEPKPSADEPAATGSSTVAPVAAGSTKDKPRAESLSAVTAALPALAMTVAALL